MGSLEKLLGYEDLPVVLYEEIVRPDCNKLKTKSMKLAAVEPQATMGMSPEQVVALANPRMFQPISVARPDFFSGLSTGTAVLGQEVGRDKVLNVLRRYAPSELRANAAAYGPPEPGNLQSARDFRAAFGVKDFLSKYDKDNIDGQGRGEWGRFPSIGRGVFFGLRDAKDHSDEGLEIVAAFSSSPEGSYVHVPLKNTAAKFLKIRRRYKRNYGVDLSFYSGASVGAGDGMTVPDDIIESYKELYDAGVRMCIRWDVTLPFPGGGTAFSYSKNLRHNNEVVLCLRKGAGSFDLHDLFVELRNGQVEANDTRNKKLYGSAIDWAPPRTDLEWVEPLFVRSRPKNVMTGKGKRSDGILKLDNTKAKEIWVKLVRSDQKPPVPVAPVKLPMLFYGIGYEPVGLNVFDCFASFVHDPGFVATFDREHGWCRRRNRNGSDVWPTPDVGLYATWISSMENAQESDTDDSDEE